MKTILQIFTGKKKKGEVLPPIKIKTTYPDVTLSFNEFYLSVYKNIK